MSGEFDLIRRHFVRPAHDGAATEVGIGDDCAIVRPTPGMRLAVSTDLLVEGRHFLSTVAPERLGHKALAVNLSDLAACGAEPLAFTLALALPRADDDFLAAFARGLFALADAHGIALVGGDTTAGPLTLGLTVFGQVPPGQALLRRGARAGDDLWVSGVLGDARLALEVFRGHARVASVGGRGRRRGDGGDGGDGEPDDARGDEQGDAFGHAGVDGGDDGHDDGDDFDRVRRALEQPVPRVALGIALRGLASSAIDLSDGLVGDLGHVLRASGVGARVDLDALPRSAVLAAQPAALRRTCLLSGGDDYELLFTAPASRRDDVAAVARRVGVALTRCGSIEAAPGLRVVDGAGRPVAAPTRGYDHFAR